MSAPLIINYLLNSFCIYHAKTTFDLTIGTVPSGYDCALICLDKQYKIAATAATGGNTISCFCGNTPPFESEIPKELCVTCPYDFTSWCGKLNYKTNVNNTYFIYSAYPPPSLTAAAPSSTPTGVGIRIN
ncbi:hypothetical protein HDU76_005250 [Blyttiomyces sp. JEL0837]|nr:hypothetical protein HDU76_005250 [Blyttiomyces sp. JEL0837]